jgi:mono/diheme cytochrome c family protein
MAILCLGVVSTSSAPPGIASNENAIGSGGTTNRTNSVEWIALGRTLFLNSCAHCHGPDAGGDEGPDLRHAGITSGRVAKVVKNGIKGEMPSFAKKHNDRDVSALTAYILSLQ